jgi:DedD protein
VTERLLLAATLVLAGILLFPLVLSEPQPRQPYQIAVSEPVLPDRPRPAFSHASSTLTPAQLHAAAQASVVARAQDATDVQAGETQVDAFGAPVSWVLPVGIYDSLAPAVALRDRMRANRFPAHLNQASWSNSGNYQVFAGPWLDRGEAEAMQARIAELFGFRAGLVRYALEY